MLPATFLPGLQALDATQHVQVTSGVLLNHILHIIWTQCLLKLLFGNMELHYPGQRAQKFIPQPQGRTLIL